MAFSASQKLLITSRETISPSSIALLRHRDFARAIEPVVDHERLGDRLAVDEQAVVAQDHHALPPRSATRRAFSSSCTDGPSKSW